MLVQLGAVDLVKVQGVVDNAVAELLVELEELVGFGELVRVVDLFLEKLFSKGVRNFSIDVDMKSG